MAAGNQQLGFAIRAVNEASKVLKDVQRDLGAVDRAALDVGRGLGSAGGHVKAFGDRADDAAKKGRGLGDVLADVGKIAGGFVIGQALLSLPSMLGGAIGAASDLSESLSKVRVVFGDSASSIEAFARKAAENLGMARGEALAAAGTFGNLFVSMGLTQKKASGMSQKILGLAADLASFNNIDPSEALEKLRAGLVGEAEPLRALGVNMNEAAVEAKALEMGLAKTATELTEADKVTARYALILEQTKTAQGDFARTADGNANQMRILRARMQDLKATIGEALLPVVVTLGGALLAVAEKLTPVIGKLAELAGSAITSGMAQLRDVVGTIVSFAWDPVRDGADALGELAAVAGRFAWGALKAFGEFVRDTLGPPLRDAAGYVADLAEAVGEFVWDGIRDAAGYARDLAETVAAFAWEQIREFGAFARDVLWPPLRDAGEAVAALALAAGQFAWEKIRDFGDWAKDTFGPTLERLAEKAREIGANVLTDPQDDIARGWETSLSAIADAWDRLDEAARPVIDILRPFVQDVLQAGRDAVEPLVPAFRDLGKALGELGQAFAPLLPLWKELLPVLKVLGEILGVGLVAAIVVLLVQVRLLVTVLGTALLVAVKALTLGIEAIAPVIRLSTQAFAEVVQFFSGTVIPAVEGVARTFGGLVETVAGLASEIAGKVRAFYETGLKLMNALWDGLIDIFKAVLSWAGRIGDEIISAIGDVSKLLFDIGKAIAQSLLDGLVDGAKAIYDEVSGWAGKIKSLKGPIAEDRRLLRPEGEAIAAGLLDGLNTGFEGVATRVSSWARGINSQFAKGWQTVDQTMATSLRAIALLLQRGLEQGTAVSDAGIKQLFTAMVDATYTSGFPEALGEEIREALGALVTGFVQGKGVANQALIELIGTILIGLQSAVPVVATAAKAVADAAVPPIGPNPGATYSGTTGRRGTGIDNPPDMNMQFTVGTYDRIHNRTWNGSAWVSGNWQYAWAGARGAEAQGIADQLFGTGRTGEAPWTFTPWGGQFPIPGFAHGVRGFGGGWALVGEEGPEIVRLPRGSDVYPAGETRRRMGGDQHVHVHVNAMDARSVRDWLDRGGGDEIAEHLVRRRRIA